MSEVAAIVGPEHFHAGANRTIFAHLQSLASDGGAIDIELLTDSLKRKREYKAAGGPGCRPQTAADVTGSPRIPACCRVGSRR